MLHFPTILGYLVAKLPGRKPRSTTARSTPLRFQGRAPRAGLLPIGFYKRRKKRRTEHHSVGSVPVECCCFRHCDWLYQQMTAEQKLVWKRARKRRGISAYDLWMSECLALTIQHKRPPDIPSISGGFSTAKAVAGSLLPLAPCWPVMLHPPPVLSCGIQHIADPSQNHWRLYCTWAPDVLDYLPDQRRIDYQGWVGLATKWQWKGQLLYPDTTKIWFFSELNKPHPGSWRWPHGVPHLAQMPCTVHHDWSILEPNRLPWISPPRPEDPWPNYIV